MRLKTSSSRRYSPRVKPEAAAAPLWMTLTAYRFSACSAPKTRADAPVPSVQVTLKRIPAWTISGAGRITGRVTTPSLNSQQHTSGPQSLMSSKVDSGKLGSSSRRSELRGATRARGGGRPGGGPGYAEDNGTSTKVFSTWSRPRALSQGVLTWDLYRTPNEVAISLADGH